MTKACAFVTFGTLDISSRIDTMGSEMLPLRDGARTPIRDRPKSAGHDELPVLDGPRLDLPAPDVAAAAATAALLADRNRAGILRLLRDGPHCVCEMAAALGERQNNISMHLARLRNAGLIRPIEHHGDGRWVYYERDEAACIAADAALRDVLG